MAMFRFLDVYQRVTGYNWVTSVARWSYNMSRLFFQPHLRRDLGAEIAPCMRPWVTWRSQKKISESRGCPSNSWPRNIIDIILTIRYTTIYIYIYIYIPPYIIYNHIYIYINISIPEITIHKRTSGAFFHKKRCESLSGAQEFYHHALAPKSLDRRHRWLPQRPFLERHLTETRWQLVSALSVVPSQAEIIRNHSSIL